MATPKEILELIKLDSQNYPAAILPPVFICWLSVPDCVFYNKELLNVYTTIQLPTRARTSEHDTLCLLTQLTSSRINRLHDLADHWKGPISAAIYVSEKNLNALRKSLLKWISDTRRTNIILSLVQENGELYPVNHLRNIAINNTLAQYILTVDVDFLPSQDLYDKIVTWLDTGFLQEGKKALVIPAFELTDDFRVPATKTEAIEYYKKGTLLSFHSSYFPVGHGATQPDIWVNTDEIYQITYQLQYEPYTVISRKDSPMYSELFLQRFFNKAVYTYTLFMRGWSFYVMPDGYLVHKPHKYHPETSDFIFRCVRKTWIKYQKSLALHKMAATEYLL